jgi:hypothetical protein
VTEWLNSEPLGPAELRDHVVVVKLWTSTCINWLRQERYVRAWSPAPDAPVGPAGAATLRVARSRCPRAQPRKRRPERSTEQTSAGPRCTTSADVRVPSPSPEASPLLIVSRHLGHATPQVTSRVYVRLLNDGALAAVPAAFAEALAPLEALASRQNGAQPWREPWRETGGTPKIPVRAG